MSQDECSNNIKRERGKTMSNNKPKGNVAVLGIDLAKQSFQLQGVDAKGQVVIKKNLSRHKLIEFIAQLPSCIIGIEACGGANYGGGFLSDSATPSILLHRSLLNLLSSRTKMMRLTPKRSARQYNDPRCVLSQAKAFNNKTFKVSIESAARPSPEEQPNQIRGLLMEYGIIIPKGISYIRQQIPSILEDAENELTFLFRELLIDLYDEMVHLDQRIKTLETKLEALCAHNEDCQRLLTIPGVGLLSATALVAAIDDITVFKSGRELAAWLGLVPRQHSTGGKPTLLGISKRGDTYLRTLSIHGGRTVVRVAAKHQDRRSEWICKLKERRGKNRAAVAVANKNALTAWSC
jgi:transposase